jgi:two-component system OmpR family sensor kinase
MKSIRWTVLSSIAVVSVGVGVVGVAASYWLGKNETEEFLDSQLVQVALQVGDGNDVLTTPIPKWDPEDELVVQIWDTNGRLIKASGGVDLPCQAAPGFADRTVRGIAWRLFTARSNGHTVQIGQRQEVRDELVAHQVLSAAGPILAALPLAWAILALSLNQMFRRLDQTSTRLARRSVSAADRLPATEAPTEIRPLIEAMNELLARQAAALERQRQFVSDAAHELRTPLTAQQLLIDTLRAREQQTSGCESDVTRDLASVTRRSRAVSEQLLRLARADAAPTGASVPTLDLREALLEIVAGHVPYATQRGIELGLQAPATLPVEISRDELASLLSNLIDNAIRYSPRGGRVEVTLAVDYQEAVIDVADTGPGIPVEALPRIFDRFFRATSQDIEGTGLGLAIARTVADRNALGLSVANRTGGGILARVTFSRMV